MWIYSLVASFLGAQPAIPGIFCDFAVNQQSEAVVYTTCRVIECARTDERQRVKCRIVYMDFGRSTIDRSSYWVWTVPKLEFMYRH